MNKCRGTDALNDFVRIDPGFQGFISFRKIYPCPPMRLGRLRSRKGLHVVTLALV